MTGSRISGESSEGSDLSSTASNPNSSPTTPIKSNYDSNSQQLLGITGDDESYPEEPVEGWPKVAAFMAETPDFTSFGRFRDLNIKSLLYYQAELNRFRLKLHETEWRDN